MYVVDFFYTRSLFPVSPPQYFVITKLSDRFDNNLLCFFNAFVHAINASSRPFGCVFTSCLSLNINIPFT